MRCEETGNVYRHKQYVHRGSSFIVMFGLSFYTIQVRALMQFIICFEKHNAKS